MQKVSDPQFNPHISVDCVIFGFDFEKLNVLIIERDAGSADAEKPSSKHHALPGNLIMEEETLDDSAKRVLMELTGLKNIYLEQFHAFGDPDRVRMENDTEWLRTYREKPQARVITVAYFSLVKMEAYVPQPSSFARKVDWFPINEAPALAFDHDQILRSALQSLKTKLRYQPIGFELLPRKFTLSQMQKLYEAILGKELDKRNFRRKILNMGILIPLDEKQKGVPHKPAKLYKFDKEKYEAMVSSDFDYM